MRLREFIREKKIISAVGEWSDKRLPKAGGKFQLTRTRGLRLGGRWRWRVVEIDQVGREFRLLIAYDPSKENYMALLGTPVSGSGNLLILGSLESHGTHPGWHFHGSCSDAAASNAGRVHHPGLVRVPGPRARHRPSPFPRDDESATEIAERYFRLPRIDPFPKQPMLDLQYPSPNSPSQE